MPENPNTAQVRMLQIVRGTHKAVPWCADHGAGVPQIQLGDYAYCAKGDCGRRLTYEHVRVRKGTAANAK